MPPKTCSFWSQSLENQCLLKALKSWYWLHVELNASKPGQLSEKLGHGLLTETNKQEASNFSSVFSALLLGACGSFILKIPYIFFYKLFVKYPPAHVSSILKEYHSGILVPDKNDNLAGEADI